MLLPIQLARAVDHEASGFRHGIGAASTHVRPIATAADHDHDAWIDQS